MASYEDDDSGRVWVIDTSSVIEVRRCATSVKARRTAYEGLTQLVGEERLFFPAQVLAELRRAAGDKKNWKDHEDLPLAWAEQSAKVATQHGDSTVEVATVVLPQVGEILDDEKQDEEADPYVLGLAVKLRQGGLTVTIITQETRDRPDKMSMSTAAGLLGFPAVPVHAFLIRRGYLTQT